MASPRDLLGPYPFRGLRSEQDAYGDAVVCENVQWDGDVMRTRDGLSRALDLRAADSPARVLFCTEYFPRGSNSPLLIVVFVNFAGQGVLQTWRRGDAAPIENWNFGVLAGLSVRAVEGFGKLWLLVHTDKSIYAETIYQVEPTGDVIRPAPIDRKVTPTGGTDDDGAYRTQSDDVRAILGCAHLDRLWVVQDEDPWVLWYSNLSDPYGWPLNNNVAPFGDEHEAVTAIVSWAGRLVAFTRTKIAVLSFDGQGTQRADVLRTSIGSVGAVVQAGEHLVFIADDGVFQLDATFNITQASSLGGALNGKIWDRLRPYLTGVRLEYYASRRQLWMLVPDLGEVYVYDYKAKAWAVYHLHPVTTIIAQDNYIDAIGRVVAADFSEAPLVCVNKRPDAVFGTSTVALSMMHSANEDDYSHASYGTHRVAPRWVSHPVPMHGHDLHRLYTHAWLLLRHKPSGKLRVSWGAEGQAISGILQVYGGTQFKDVPHQSPTAVPLAGVHLVGGAPIYVAADAGETEFEAKVTFFGKQRGRWVQILVTDDFTGYGRIGCRSFRLITRAHVSPRER